MRTWGMIALAGALVMSLAGLTYAQGGSHDPAGRTDAAVDLQAAPSPKAWAGVAVSSEADEEFEGERGESGWQEVGKCPTCVRRPQSEQEESWWGDEDKDRGETPRWMAWWGHPFKGLHHCGRLIALGLVALAVIPVLIVLFWVAPIVLGVRIARRKKLSPLWMLFGIKPLAGWIACLVLALTRGKVECASCGGYIKPNFRQCPYCKATVPGETAPKAKG